MTTYDGRHSDLCKTTCQAGECGSPRTVDGCGSCCGCLGGCETGYEEQLAEEASSEGETSALHEGPVPDTASGTGGPTPAASASSGASGVPVRQAQQRGVASDEQTPVTLPVSLRGEGNVNG